MSAWENFRGAWTIERTDHLWRKRYITGARGWGSACNAEKKSLSPDMLDARSASKKRKKRPGNAGKMREKELNTISAVRNGIRKKDWIGKKEAYVLNAGNRFGTGNLLLACDAEKSTILPEERKTAVVQENISGSGLRRECACIAGVILHRDINCARSAWKNEGA